MTHEIRINVDADMYYRPDQYGNEAIDAEKTMKAISRRLEEYFKGFGADHKFVKIDVKDIPHDNDRNYTDEDAEKHLYGEPKRRKTYAEDFFEKFPGAERNEKGYPVVSFAEVWGYDKFYKMFCALDYLRKTGEVSEDVYIWGLPMEDESDDEK